jgi:signal transduction histidine kinase
MSRGTTRSNPGSLVSGLAAKLNALELAVTRQTERFAAIIEVGAQISAARDVDQLLRTVMDRLTALLGVEAATLYMHDEAAHELWSRVMKGADLTELRTPVDKGLAGHVFRTRKTLILGDAYNDPRFNPEVDKQSGFRTRSVIATPLQHMSGRILGVLQVLDRRVDLFKDDDKVLVEGVANQIAAVLDNVLLVEDLKANRAQLEHRVRELDALYDIEQAISPSSDHKDLLDRILTRAMEATGATAGSILLVEEERDNSLHFRTTRGVGSEALTSLRLAAGQGIAGHVAATGEVVRVAHASESEHHDRSIARKLGVPIEAALCVPIVVERRRLGALELLNNPRAFSAADEKLAVVLSGQIGRALEDLETREERERLTRLSTIGQMLAGVLHDLRTPLTVIAGYSEMMATEDDRGLRVEMSKSIVAQLQLVNAMQQETLAFARGERTVLLRKVYLNVFMREVSTQLLQEFASSKVDLKVQVTYSGTARFDENKIRRAIFNLARNSIEAMPTGGKFTLQVEREGAELIFRASDNGPGIPSEIADKLFESFVTAGKKNGTGLGLAMVRKIAKEHGGGVSCKSKPGKGTVFELRFPAGGPAD